MKDSEIRRLSKLEERVREIAEENGLVTQDIEFEIVTPERMIEAMAYMLPTNFSHWSRGRDYEKQKTIYDYSGAGIPYEVVWDQNPPRAFLVDTNPFALNATIIPHVYGHVDFFNRNILLKNRGDTVDIARESRNATHRFQDYESKFGIEKLERLQDAGMSIQWLQDPNPFMEEVDEEEIRRRLIEEKREKLQETDELAPSRRLTQEEVEDIERELKHLKYKTPPTPQYDVLKYITEHSPKPLREWEKDVLEVLRRQARFLGPQMRTKLLNEGWATYWHTRIMRQLYQEGYLNAREHGVFNDSHSKVLAKHKKGLNWYRVGLALYEYIEDRWDKGQFGKEYEDSEDPNKRLNWDAEAMKGREKIFEVSSLYTDRMAIEHFFTPEFIHNQELYIWGDITDPTTGEAVEVILEKRPFVIQQLMKEQHTLYNIPLIAVTDGNYNEQQELYLRHDFTGFELNPQYEWLVLEKVYNELWGRPVHLETLELEYDDDGEVENTISIMHTYDGERHKIFKDGKQV